MTARGAVCRAVFRARGAPEIWNAVAKCLVGAGYTAAAVSLGREDAGSLRLAACAGIEMADGPRSSGERDPRAVVSPGADRGTEVDRELGERSEGDPMIDAACELGSRSLARMWVRPHGGPEGLLTLFAPEADAFDDDELVQLQELALDVAAAVEALGLRRAQPSAPFADLLAGSAAGRVPAPRTQRGNERALREQLEMIRSITDSATDAILLADEKGRITYWNRAAQKIFGWTADDALGRELASLLVPQAYRAVFEQGLEEFITSGRGAAVGDSFEASALRKDGAVVPIEVSVSSVQLRGRWQAIGIVRDITERQRHLEDLTRAMRAAEAAAEAKSLFLANVSHELRTPLNGIIGMTDLLLLTELSSRQRDFAGIVKRSGEVLLSVINDILDFSKMDAEALELDSIVFSVRACVEEVGDLLSQKAAERKIELVVLIDHQVPGRVTGDPGRLRQVLTNLVNNAIKFTSEGEVVIRVRPAEIDDRGLSLEFRVEDTGIGIPGDRIQQLFKPFTQLDASTTREYGGTGLGLSIASKLVTRMGGTLDVESTVGEGSTFRFTISFERADVEDPGHHEHRKSLRDLRVLVVDDNATNRRLLEELLAQWGCHTVAAASGQDAIDILFSPERTSKVDVAILDFSMPGMDGLTLAASIKANPAFSDLPLILLTSMPELGDAGRMQQAGFSAYLTKPVKPSHLYDGIVSVISGTAVAEHEGAAPPIVTSHTLNEARRSRVRILVVEDNLINQKVLTRMLERLGYRCDLAENGQEAVDALVSRTYDLVFMDCQMPVMGGFEATRRIRAFEGGSRHTRIIATTAEALKGDRERCLAAGMDDYIAKPIAFDDLANALGKVTPAAVGAEAPGSDGALVLDTARLEEISRGDPEFRARIIDIFLKETEGRRAAIAGASDGGDFEQLRAEAHCLKGGAANIGVARVAEIAGTLQRAAEACDSEACTELRRRLFREIDIAVAELQRELDEGGTVDDREHDR